MSQFKVYVLFPLLVLGLIYAGLKLYIYYNVSSEMERLAAMAGPFARVTYNGIGSDLRGSVSLERVEIRRPERMMPVRIAEIRLEGPNTAFLFDLLSGFDRGRFPEHLRLVLERVELPDVSDLLPTQFSLSGGGPAGAQESEKCSLGWLMQHLGMFQSDSYPLLVDLSAGYRFDVNSALAGLNFNYRVHSGERVEMEVQLSGVPQPGVLMAGMVPTIDQLVLLYEPGWDQVTQRVGGCATEQGTDPEGYVQGILGQTDERLSKELGYVPGAGIREALQRFLLDPREVRVELGPLEDAMALSATEHSPQEMLALLNPRVSVNGTPVTDLSFRQDSPPGWEEAGADRAYDTAATGEKRPRVRARMLPITVAELPNYLGRDVHIYTPTHERPLEGILRSVLNDRVNVEKRVHGGTMTLHVPLDEITRVAVLRFPKPGE
jgi:hypothetical protein